MESKVECSQLADSSLGVIDELCALFPKWKRFSVEKKINATLRGSDKRFVARLDGKIVAHVRIVFGKGIHSHRVEVLSLIVLPKFRRKGIGTKLVLFALGSLPKSVGLAILSVDSKNKPAVSVYKKLGFSKYGLLKGAAVIDGAAVDNLLMQKKL